MTVQLAITLLIVAAAVGYAVWRIVRTFSSRGGCNCSTCPHSGKKECHCHQPKLPDIDPSNL